MEIESKPKKCKGTGAAKNNGCEVTSNYRRLGLCPQCYPKWLMNTPEGQERILKMRIKGSKVVKSRMQASEKKEKAEQRERIETPDSYRARIIQPKINKIARLIDSGLPCICTGKFGKMNGGHYIAVGRNRTTGLNLHNIHRQSFASNHFKSGDETNYRLGLINEYGEDYFNFIEGLKQTPLIKLSVPELKVISQKASEIINTYHPQELNAAERIEMRNKINRELGIYSENENFLK